MAYTLATISCIYENSELAGRRLRWIRGGLGFVEIYNCGLYLFLFLKL